MKPNHIEIANEQFAAYEKLDVIHISSDDQVFHQVEFSAASDHQRKVDSNQKLLTIYRKDLDKLEDMLEEEMNAEREEQERVRAEEKERDRVKAEEEEAARVKAEEEEAELHRVKDEVEGTPLKIVKDETPAPVESSPTKPDVKKGKNK